MHSCIYKKKNKKERKVKLINHDCLPILVLLYIILSCLMLFAVLSNAFLPFIFANTFCLHDLSWIIDTQFVYFMYYFASCAVLLICWFFVILCSHRCCCFLSFYVKGLCALWRNSTRK